MKISEIMTGAPACGVPESRLEEIARLMVQKDCGAIPIVEDLESRRLVGVVTDRDITCRSLANSRDPMELTANDVMTTILFTVTPDATLEECCGLMEKNQVRRMIVVDANGACVGIVAQADIARVAPENETAELVKDVSKSAFATA